MLRQSSLLVSLVLLIDKIPLPPKSDTRKRRRPKAYSERLILKALLVMIIRRLYTAYSLLAFLEQADWVAQQLKVRLHEDGKFPSRRTWERRLVHLPNSLPELLGYPGRHLVSVLKAWAEGG